MTILTARKLTKKGTKSILICTGATDKAKLFGCIADSAAADVSAVS